MKNRFIQIAALLALAACLTGCASPYMVDRGRDVADIFTASFGLGAGVQGRAGPFHAGILCNANECGLRSGTFHVPKETDTLPAEGSKPRSFDFDFLLFKPTQLGFGVDIYQPEQVQTDRGKAVDAVGILPLFYTFDMGSDKEEDDAPSARQLLHNYTQIEAVVGLGGTLRCGFNPGELLDFILGWTTIDIFNDDLEKRKRIEQDKSSVRGIPRR